MAEPELVQLKVLVPKELRRRLKVLAAETGKPMNELVTRAITVLVQRKGEL
jgi:predicted DNA-binding protein